MPLRTFALVIALVSAAPDVCGQHLGAFDLPGFAIADLPSWAEAERFDIRARAGTSQPQPVPANAEMLMLRTLLEDRFQLATHTETRNMQVYALVIARRDGQPGPQLRRSSLDCRAAAAGAASPCGGQNGPGFVKGAGREISALVPFLASQVQRPVVDRTGLTGSWDIELTFNPDSPGDPRPRCSPHCRNSSVCGSNRRARRCRCS